VSYKICINNPFLNCEKVHPLQQRGVSELLDALDKSYVNAVWLFGSSVTDRCHNDSDIDIYVELDLPEDVDKENPRLVMHYVPYVYDLWTNYLADENLKNEIFRTGVMVYEGKRNIA
jgi:predicted nucleotidyltransferase